MGKIRSHGRTPFVLSNMRNLLSLAASLMLASLIVLGVSSCQPAGMPCKGVMTDSAYDDFKSAQDDVASVDDDMQRRAEIASGGNLRAAERYYAQNRSDWMARRDAAIQRMVQASRAAPVCRGDGVAIWTWKEPLSSEVLHYCDACKTAYGRQFPDREFTRR